MSAPDHPFNTRDKILAVVLVYAIFAGLWIVLSDKLVEFLFISPEKIILVSMYKGWLFVGITSLLLYGLMRRWIGGTVKANPQAIRPGLPFALFAVTTIAFAGVAITHEFIHKKQTEIARLQAIADLKTRQITDWLQERQGDAEFVKSNEFFAEQYHQWQTLGDPHGGARLKKRLDEFSLNKHFNAITLLSPNGEKYWGSTLAPLSFMPILQSGIISAVKDPKIHWVGPYRGKIDNLRLDILTPLTARPPPYPMVILHIDLANWLLPTLGSWPVPSTSGEMLLFRRDGEDVAFLSELRHQKNSAAKLRLPLSTQKLLSAQALRGEAGLGAPIEGLDYRGVPAIGVVRAIAGTDWFLLAKIDQSELYQDALDNTLWIGFTGMLLLFMSGSIFYLFRQHQQLVFANLIQKTQAERLNALNLLAAISESSSDAIFAKDLEGRYILFNDAASRFIGKPAEEVIGKDDNHIFPDSEANRLISTDKRIMAENILHTSEEKLTTVYGERIFFATKGPLHDTQGQVIGMFGISRDVTERKQAEAALLSSEQGYRSLFENILNGYAHCQMLYDNGVPQDYIYLNVNQAFETLTGLKNVVGQTIGTVIPGFLETEPELLARFNKTAVSGKPQQFESYVKTLDMWFSISVYSPKQSQFVILFDNVTERKRTELALRHSEALTRAILNSVNAHIAVLDQQGAIIAVNQPWIAFAEQNGLAFGKFARHVGIGANYLEICQHCTGLFSEDALDVANGIQAVLDGKLATFTHEYPCHSPDQQRWFTMTATPLEGEKQQGVVIAHTDITHRKLAENALSQITDDMAATLQAIPDLLFEIDATGQYIKAKTTQEGLLAAPLSELPGHTVNEILPPEAAQTVMDSITAASQNGTDYGRTITLDLPVGTRCFELSVARKACTDDNRQHFIVVSRDITERKAAEAVLRQQSLELAERNTELLRFNAAMVGRELVMIDLKKEVNALSQELGKKQPYPLAFLNALTPASENE